MKEQFQESETEYINYLQVYIYWNEGAHKRMQETEYQI